jgi:phosphatidylinositol alpha 1,6-mannosyltransferase
MAADRLHQILASIRALDVEQVFGAEFTLTPADLPAPSDLAPVRRVALFTEAFLPKVDGVTKSAYFTLKYLQQTNREVLIFAPDIAPPTLDGVRIVRVPSVGFPKVPETRVALPHPLLISELRAFRPDVVHLFSPALMSLLAVQGARGLNIPILANYQTDLLGYAPIYGVPKWLTQWGSALLRGMHNRCHRTLAPSPTILRQLRANGYKRLHLWQRGVDHVRFHPQHRTAEMRTRLLDGRPDTALLCIYVGRLATEKRVELLLEAARLPNVALTIVGDGAERERLERMFAGTGTYFSGYLFGDALAQAFASADVFLFTGANETFGQVVQEAQASALPAIVVNEGGVADLVTHGENGFVCSAQADAFAAAVVRLRDHALLRAEMGRCARERVLQNTWMRVMLQLEQHYRAVLYLHQRHAQRS